MAVGAGSMVLLAAVVLATLPTLTGCASLHRETSAFGDTWDPGVEVRFPAAAPMQEQAPQGDCGPDGQRIVAAPDVPMPPVHRLIRSAAAVTLFAVDQLGLTIVPRKVKGVPDRGDTMYTLMPGSYAFEYCAPDMQSVFGEINLYPVLTPRARDFIRHTAISVTPSPAGGEAVLNEAELERARAGDVVTKVIFIADAAAIRERLEDIDEGLREFSRLRTSLEEQESYWQRKLIDRRLNTRYSSEFGWGVDVPSADLALLQTIMGPERYHWHRFSEAEDKVRTYEKKLAELDLPEGRLREERDALEHMLRSIDVVHRSHDMLVLAPSMIRPYEDPVDEVHSLRGFEVWADSYRGKLMTDLNDWVGPFGKLHWPYLYSALSMGLLSPGLKPIAAPSGTASKNVGEVLMVIKVGARKPPELGGHRWLAKN
jgi:hypothetical protein